MTAPIDLVPAAQRLARLVAAVPEDALGRPTPCEEYTVGDLLDHVGGALATFRAAAAKDPLPRGPLANAANLADGWRTHIPAQARALAVDWGDPTAWTGMTAAGGVDLPGEVAGVIGLDEVVIHGWDLAVATGQPPGYDGPGLGAVLAMVQRFRVDGIPGLFGPEVPVAEDAPLLDRILGVTGRDPAWGDRR
ncbi:MAG: TIGR03086 family metal-binding protein [Acidimicrobiales bacterium]